MGKIILIIVSTFVLSRFFTCAQSTILPEIQLKSRVLKYKERDDTLEFNSVDYNQKNTFKLSSLLAGMPGFRVDESGRVFFNGKEIQRVLIQGEDITENQYQVLIKNLRAGLIEKVQLIKRFEENRLIRSMGQSDQVALNLVIKKEFMGRWSGSLGGGIGSKKVGVSSEIIWLDPKWKAVNFLEYSGAGLVLVDNPNPYEVKRGLEKNMMGPIQFPRWRDYFQKDFPLLLQHIGSYGRNWSGIHFRSPKEHKMSLRYETTMNRFTLNCRDELILSDLNKLLSKNRTEQVNSKEYHLDFTWKVDRGKSWLFENNIRLEIQRQNYSLKEAVAGIVNFHQHSSQLNSQRIAQITSTYSRSLSRSTVFSITHNFSFQHTHSNTYFKIVQADPFRELNGIEQRLKLNSFSDRFELKWMKDRIRMKSEIGFRNEYYSNRFFIDQQFQSMQLSKSIAYGLWSVRLHKRILSEISIAGGVVGYALNDRQWNKQVVYGFRHTLTYQPKAVSKLFQEVDATKASFDLPYYYSGSYMDARGIKMVGNDFPAFPKRFGWGIGYMKFNLHRGFSFRTMVQLKNGNHEQVLGLEWEKGYEVLRAVTSNRQYSLGATVQVDQFIFPLRTKMNVDFGMNTIRQPLYFNGDLLHNRMKKIHVNLVVSSQWKKRFNFQGRVVANTTWIRMDDKREVYQRVTNMNWTFISFVNPIDKAHIILQYQSYRTSSATRSLNLLQVEWRYLIHERMNTGFKLMNALDAPSYTRIDFSRGIYSIQERSLAGRQVALELIYSF